MLKEITMFEFNDFAKYHKLYSPFQTSNYAIYKGEENFDYEYLGYYEGSNLVAATLIIYKNITFKAKYAYAPRGFLIDYENISLLQDFVKKLKKYLKKKKFTFLKIDPLLPIREYDPLSKRVIYQEPNNYKNIFTDLGFKKLKDNLYFEAQLPRFDAYINLKDFDIKAITKNTRNKINNSFKKGLELIKASRDDLETVYSFLKNQYNLSLKNYNDLYKSFSNDDMIDIFLVKVDYETFMDSAKKSYEEEENRNNFYNELLKSNPTERNLNKKMLSDKMLITHKNRVMEASRKYSDNELQQYIAGAIVIKGTDTVNILYSGYDKLYKHLNTNYFLYYSIINYYKDNYKFLGLNGLTGDFTKENPYYGLNEFKCGFKPHVYEYIGELDLIINENVYNNLLATGRLHQVFDKKN